MKQLTIFICLTAMAFCSIAQNKGTSIDRDSADARGLRMLRDSLGLDGKQYAALEAAGTAQNQEILALTTQKLTPEQRGARITIINTDYRVALKKTLTKAQLEKYNAIKQRQMEMLQQSPMGKKMKKKIKEIGGTGD